MILCDAEIAGAVAKGALGVTPFDDRLINPASIDVRLYHQFRRVDPDQYPIVDPAREQRHMTYTTAPNTDQAFLLQPREFVLACTFETISLPNNLCARLEGKSSLGRLGLLTHATAGYIDPGFHGQVTLELSNMMPIPLALYPGMRIAQLSFMVMSAPPVNPYGGSLARSHYQGQAGPTPSRSWENFELDDTRDGRHGFR